MASPLIKIGRRRRRRALLAALSFVVASFEATRADDFRISDIRRETNGEISVQVRADPDYYYILLRGDTAGEINEPVIILQGISGPLTFNDGGSYGVSTGFYRVRRIPLTSPGDTDEDGLDDAFELRHRPVLNPLNRSDAWADPDTDGHTNWSEAHLGTDLQVKNAGPFIASGVSHTLAIDANEDLWGWGDNSVHQLGSRAASKELSPVLVTPSDDWVAVSTGSGHTVAIKKDGSLWAWGANTRGQLGVGDSSPRTDPGRVGDDTDWLTIAASDEHTLAIKRDGSLWAWGRNDWGQVGDGSQIDRLTPVRIGADSNWVAVSSRWWFSIALRSDGTMWSWGYNNLSQLGHNSSTPEFAPRQIGTDRDWALIAAGAQHALAVKSNGTLWGWGNSSSGRLGLGGSAVIPQTPIQIGAETDWAAVTCGGDQSVALKIDGTVWACGLNDSGQVGNNTQNDQYAWVRSSVPGDDWVAIAAGNRQTFAINHNRKLWGWGRNLSGELGRGNDDRILSPVQVGNASDWRFISTQIIFNLALRSDGTMWIWGAGYPPVSQVVPAQVGGATNWVAVSASREHNAALTAAGEIFTWGAGEEGQLGHGDTGDRFQPTRVGAANDWRHVSAGNWHTAAVKTDDTLWVWGANDHAALGDGTEEPKSSAIQIGSNEWRTVSAGAYHNLALKTDGSLWGWGFNNFQQLTSAAAPLQNTPLRIGADNDWAHVAGGGYHSVALKTDGSLWHWGANHYDPWIFGDPPVPPTPSPRPVGTDRDWAKIAAGRWHTLAIKQDGSLWAWGRNANGQLGIGSLIDQSTIVRVGLDTNWAAITASAEHSLALKTDGTLWGWGNNTFGELGLPQVQPVRGAQAWGPAP